MNTDLKEKYQNQRIIGGEIRGQLLDGMPVAERRLEVGGIRTAVLEGGDGPPVVLLHGQGEFGAVWMRAIETLVRTHRVIVPDLPGHGASDVGSGTLDRSRILSWLDELLEGTCAEKPVVAGHLLGGAIAARYATAYPGRLSRLVLVDSLGLAWYRPSLSFALAMVHFMARPTESTQERLFQRCMADLDGVREDMDGRMELLEKYALACARGPNVKTALQSLMPRVGLPPIPPADLTQIDTPTTLIWGRGDLQVGVEIAEDASARYGWRLYIVEDARDDPAIEQPEAFMKALHAALGTAAPAAAAEA